MRLTILLVATALVSGAIGVGIGISVQYQHDHSEPYMVIRRATYAELIQSAGPDRVVDVRLTCRFTAVRPGQPPQRHTAEGSICTDEKAKVVAYGATVYEERTYVITVRTPQGGSYVVNSPTPARVGDAWVR